MFDSIQNPRQRAFLSAYAECMQVKRAAETAGIARETHYAWLRDESYRQAFMEATDRAGDALEDVATERAIYDGSDRLLIFLLTGAKPKKYSKKIDKDVSGEVKHTHGIDLSGLDDSELDALDRLLAKAEDNAPGRRGSTSQAPTQQACVDVSGDGPAAP